LRHKKGRTSELLEKRGMQELIMIRREHEGLKYMSRDKKVSKVTKGSGGIVKATCKRPQRLRHKTQVPYEVSRDKAVWAASGLRPEKWLFVPHVDGVGFSPHKIIASTDIMMQTLESQGQHVEDEAKIHAVESQRRIKRSLQATLGYSTVTGRFPRT
jgi:hypothetical protein